MSRWWEPGSDVALLEPVGVRPVDFANALTALHRAGAAAILDAAGEHPVVDDGLLVTAMAQARAAFAPLLVTPIAKATGAGENYAGLLLAEVFDEAEVGALRLFQLAVARGVPRRAAAERVARVYGVPGEDLGRYAWAATDPKTPPAVLADLGDETLFASIAARCEAEGPEPVDKAESRETRAAAQADQPRQHGRYAAIAGRSAQDWLTEQMTGAHLVEEEREVVAAPAEVAAAPRRLRQPLRKLRGAALVREPEARAGSIREASTRVASTREASVREATLRKLAVATNKDLVVVERPEHPAGRERPVPDWDQMYPDAPIAEPLGYAVSVALPINEANTFFRDVGRTHGGDKVFRAGCLVGPGGYAGEATQASGEHDAVVAVVAATIKGGSAYAGTRPPYVRELTPDQLNALGAASPAVQETRLKEMKRDLIEAWAVEHEVQRREVPAATELPNVFLYQAYADRSSWLLVYLPPPAHGDKRPLPNVATMTMPATVRGRHEAGSRHGADTYVVDRSQPLVRKIPRDQQGAAQPDEKYYDVALGTLRTIIPLELGSEGDIDDAVAGIHKAESRETRAAAQADQPRRHGEYGPRIAGRSAPDWLTEQMTGAHLVEAEAEAPAPRRRLRRLTRLSPAAREIDQRGASTRPASVRAPQLRPSSQRLLDAADATPETYFDPLDDYTLATGHELTHKVGVTGHGSQMIGQDGVAWLANSIHRDASRSKEGAVLLRADDDWDRLATRSGTRVLDPTYIDSDADWNVLERRLAGLLYDEGVQAVTLERHKVIVDGRPRLRVELAAARRKLPPQHAVRWASGTGDEKALRLVHEGESNGLSRETLHTLVEQMLHQDRDAAGNYPLGGTYVIVNPRVIRWHVERPD